MSGAYYNEIDPYAAEWLRNLILFGHIAPGDVDTRSIEDVSPDDLRPYTQCHFFAGIGVWSHALRSAGWDDETPVWTGSCPCQPFSSAGQGAGFDDERHLWPAFHHLIEECRPAIVLGEQVASKDADPWIDLVQADVEAMGYAFGAVPFPSASVGAPHIRDRLYWVARADNTGLERRGQPGRERAAERIAGSSGLAGWLGHAVSTGRQPEPNGCGCDGERVESRGGVSEQPCEAGIHAGRLANASCERRQQDPGSASGNEGSHGSARWDRIEAHSHNVAASNGEVSGFGPTGPTNGYWRDADWLFCRDGKWRPVEPGTSPLAHGASARVGRLRAYGNAINAKAAQVFIECVMGR